MTEAIPAEKDDRFLKPKSELTPNMTEHHNGYVAPRKNVKVIGDLDIRTVFSTRRDPTSHRKELVFMGVAYHIAGEWYTTMGFCYVGSYKSWEHALTNLIIAFFG